MTSKIVLTSLLAALVLSVGCSRNSDTHPNTNTDSFVRLKPIAMTVINDGNNIPQFGFGVLDPTHVIAAAKQGTTIWTIKPDGSVEAKDAPALTPQQFAELYNSASVHVTAKPGGSTDKSHPATEL